MGSRPVDLRLPVFSRQLALTKFGVMLSDTPQTNLWIERTRLNGMMFGGVSYGIFTLLTVQAATALMQRPRCGGQIANNRLVLLVYIFITFTLGTVCYAANARFTEMIWIDLRDAPGGPLALIENALDYRINMVAVFTYFIMGWCMQALLLHRCSVIWCRARSVMVPMIVLFVAMLVSILIMIQATTSAQFFNIDTMLLYLCMEVGFTLIYTILVTSRLLVMRSRMKQAVAQYNSSTYDTVILMLIESAMLYSVFCVILIVSIVLHSDGVSNLFYLSITNVQGIAQLLIIIRVARRRAISARAWSTRVTAGPASAAPTSIVFSRTISDMVYGADTDQIATPEQDGVPLYSIHSAKAAEANPEACIDDRDLV